MFISCIKLTMLTLAANIALTPVNQALAVMAGYALVLLSIAMPFTAVSVPLTPKVSRGLFYLMIMVLFLMMSYVVKPTALSSDLQKNMLTFISTYAAIAVDGRVFHKRDLNHIFRTGKILSLIYVAYTFLPFPFRYTILNEWGLFAFTMNMGNPNATAISVMFCILLMIGDMQLTGSRIRRILDYTLAMLLVYTIYRLGSRTALACSIVLILFPFFRKMRVRMMHVYIAMLIPIVFVGLQLWIAASKPIVLLGKPLASGRDRLYIGYLQQICADPLGYVFGEWGIHKMANYHNAPVAFLMNFGIMGILAYYMFWSFELRQMVVQQRESPVRPLAIIGILMFFIHSSAEAAPMLGSVMYGAEITIVCRMAKDRFVD